MPSKKKKLRKVIAKATRNHLADKIAFQSNPYCDRELPSLDKRIADALLSKYEIRRK